MDANRLEDLGRLYQVMDRVRALEPLRKHFAAYIKVQYFFSLLLHCLSQAKHRHRIMVAPLSVTRPATPKWSRAF